MKKALLAVLVIGTGAVLVGCPDKTADTKPDPAVSAKPPAAASASAAPKAGGGW